MILKWKKKFNSLSINYNCTLHSTVFDCGFDCYCLRPIVCSLAGSLWSDVEWFNLMCHPYCPHKFPIKWKFSLFQCSFRLASYVFPSIPNYWQWYPKYKPQWHTQMPTCGISSFSSSFSKAHSQAVSSSDMFLINVCIYVFIRSAWMKRESIDWPFLRHS